MIDAEMNEASRHMLLQQGTTAQQIENDTPASDLGMMVTRRVVLPTVSELI